MYRSRAYINVNVNIKEGEIMDRVVLLNALPLNAFPPEWRDYAIQIMKAELEDVYQDIVEAREIKCYIRHPATVQLLQEIFEIELTPSAEAYKYNPDDIVYIVTLKTPQRGKEATEVSLEDVEFYEMYASEGVWL